MKVKIIYTLLLEVMVFLLFYDLGAFTASRVNNPLLHCNDVRIDSWIRGLGATCAVGNDTIHFITVAIPGILPDQRSSRVSL